MPIGKKPKTEEEFIRGGGSEPSEVPVQLIDEKAERSNQQNIQPVKLRIERELLDAIDAAVASRKPAISRHQWMLEAFYEKLANNPSRSSNES